VWVGIDGFSSSTVEQIGTDSDIVNGKAQYYVWWEAYPAASTDVTTMSISAGDTITASVMYLTSGAHAGQFEMTIADTSQTGDSFTTYQTVAQAQRSSAEWVVEAPSSTSGVLPLANFGSVTFTNATATIDGVTGPIDGSKWQAASINMASGATLEASTSALTDSASASSFTVTYDSSVSSASNNVTKTNQHVTKPRLLVSAVAPTAVSAPKPAAKASAAVSVKDLVFATFGLAKS
jgi:hypothetical protein